MQRLEQLNKPAFLGGAALLVLVLGVAALWWPSAQQPSEVSAPVAVEAVVPPPSEPVVVERPPAQPVSPPIDTAPPSPPSSPQPVQPALPPLADSDAFVRTELATWALPEAWWQFSDLLARVAVVLANTAQEQIPKRQVAELVPTEAFAVRREGDRYWLDPAGYRRFDAYLDVLEGIPPRVLAMFLQRVDPLLQVALGQLGVRAAPRALLAETLAAVRRVQPLPTAPVELKRPSVMYVYADPELERQTDLAKQLLRAGPENLSRLKSYLTEFEEYYFN